MMTIEKARTLLNPAYEGLTDDQIQGMIDTFRLYSKLVVSHYLADKKKSVNGS